MPARLPAQRFWRPEQLCFRLAPKLSTQCAYTLQHCPVRTAWQCVLEIIKALSTPCREERCPAIFAISLLHIVDLEAVEFEMCSLLGINGRHYFESVCPRVIIGTLSTNKMLF